MDSTKVGILGSVIGRLVIVTDGSDTEKVKAGTKVVEARSIFGIFISNIPLPSCDRFLAAVWNKALKDLMIVSVSVEHNDDTDHQS